MLGFCFNACAVPFSSYVCVERKAFKLVLEIGSFFKWGTLHVDFTGYLASVPTPVFSSSSDLCSNEAVRNMHMNNNTDSLRCNQVKVLYL